MCSIYKKNNTSSQCPSLALFARLMFLESILNATANTIVNYALVKVAGYQYIFGKNSI